jgi:magnesium transporter
MTTMRKASDLTLALISKRPESAARALASLPSKDSAEFVASIPTRFAVPLFSRLNASRGAELLLQMDAEAATAIMRDLDSLSAAAILRRLSDSEREPIMSGLPRRQRRNFETSLAFAPNTVGANMSMRIDTVLATETAASVLQRKKEGEHESELTFLVNDKREFVGVIGLLELLRCPGAMIVGDIADTDVVPVSPHQLLSHVLNADLWQDYSELPVASRSGELLGAISKRSIFPTDVQDAGDVSAATTSLAVDTIGVMAHSSLSLFRMLTITPRQHDTPGESDGS